MKVKMILVTAVLGLMTTSCTNFDCRHSEMGCYNYKTPYTYDPADPDYRTTLNVPEHRDPYFQRDDAWPQRHYSFVRGDCVHVYDHTPGYNNDSVIVFPVND